MAFVSEEALVTALERLKGTANHLLKIWLTLKQMGMSSENPVYVTTSSPNSALKRLFSYGDPGSKHYVPFAATKRFLTMASDADRSIIQTTIQRWLSSGSVVTADPTSYIKIAETDNQSLEVKPGRAYPQGLGFGENGFALKEEGRVALPLLSFGIWYYRQHEFPSGSNLETAVRQALIEDLNLTNSELDLIFVPDEPSWLPKLQREPLSDEELYGVVHTAIERGAERKEVIRESFESYSLKVRSMTTVSEGPSWLNVDPKTKLKQVLDGGSKAVLLYGPPRTGKTYAIDQIISRDDSDRETIQIHDGWGYDELMVGLRPTGQGGWEFEEGPLLKAIAGGKKSIVLEEINRTDFSQSIGEVFSLLEADYRGQTNEIRLRDGTNFFIPEETLIVCTMNTLDRSTEEIDDALFGRMDAIEFPPRVEDLNSLLQSIGITEGELRKWSELFSTIRQYYPLGHGYFATLRTDSNPISFYLTRVRPVLQKHLKDYRDQDLAAIDEKMDQLFA